MKKILLVSNFNNNKYGNYSINLIKNLNIYNKNEFAFNVFSINSIDNDKFELKNKISNILNLDINNIFTLDNINNFNLNNKLDSEYLKYYLSGLKNINKIILNFNPDYVLIIENLKLINILVPFIKNIRNKWFGKIIPMISYDYSNLNVDNLQFKNDNIITFSDFHKYEILKLNSNYNIKTLNPLLNFNFHKINDNDILKFKIKLLGEENKNKFIISVFSKNLIKNRFDLIFDSFFKFYKNFQNSLLLIKTDNTNNNNCFDFNYLIKYYSNKYKINNINIKFLSIIVDYNILNNLYNIIDLNINACDGSEIGIMPLELALCKKITLLPNHSIFNSYYNEINRNKSNCNFLLETKKYPLNYIRESKNLDNLLNKNIYYCIYKNFISYKKNKVKFVDNFNITNNIDTIYLTNYSNDDFEININPIDSLNMFRHVKTLNKALNIIENLSDEELPDRLQILISSDLNIINECYETLQKFYYKLKNKYSYRNIIICEPSILKNKVLNGNNCNLISSNSIFNKILFYYNNKDILKNDEEYVCELINKKLNNKNNTKDFVNFLHKISNTNNTNLYDCD